MKKPRTSIGPGLSSSLAYGEVDGAVVDRSVVVDVVEVDVVVVVTGAVVTGGVVTIGALVPDGVQAAATRSTASRARRRIMIHLWVSMGGSDALASEVRRGRRIWGPSSP